jgi:glutamyl-tRNA reductase
VQSLYLLGLNHATAPLELREQFAFDAPRRSAILRDLRERFGSCEAVILCTCNRVELYVAKDAQGSPRQNELAEFFAELRAIPLARLEPHLYHKADRHAVQHLFSVAASLDSMVVGETQILGQVRQAYQEAQEAGAAGTILHPLFQRAVSVGKQVIRETSLAEGRLSVASIAVDHAHRIFDVFSDKTVLNIGAGKMAGLLLANLAALGPRKLLVCNRDAAKAVSLAGRYSADVVPFNRLAEHLADADIIVSSTGSESPIITRPLFESAMRARRYKPVFLIDIAVPRDIAAEVGKLENVYLYNLDDLQQVAAATRGQRSAAIEAAGKIVAEHVRDFSNWSRVRQLGPFIDELYRRSHAQAKKELDRALAKLPPVSESEKQHLEDLTRRIVNKLLHDPMQMLRQSDGQHAPVSQAQYLHAIEKLFKLDSEESEDASES